jgi:hypothetical protein
MATVRHLNSVFLSNIVINWTATLRSVMTAGKQTWILYSQPTLQKYTAWSQHVCPSGGTASEVIKAEDLAAYTVINIKLKCNWSLLDGN